MKRSEMSRILRKEIQKYGPYKIGNRESYLILKIIEDAGMLPPAVSPVPQNIIDDCLSANYWEDEDYEKK